MADHKLLRHCLRQAGIVCNIHWTDNLQDFTTEVSTKVFDAVIADYYLPGFTALDAWQALQQQAQARDTPFILLSGAIGETAAVEAIQQGLADYVLKDAIVRLPHVLARALEMAETRRAKAQALQDLEASRAQLAALTEHLQSSIEQERAGIAREIHDDIGGALTAVKFDVSWMVRNAHNAAGVAEHGQAALEMLQHALGASQRIMMNLRPPRAGPGVGSGGALADAKFFPAHTTASALGVPKPADAGARSAASGGLPHGARGADQYQQTRPSHQGERGAGVRCRLPHPGGA